ncbi:MAG TPA: SRPBCC family protein [Acidimicrobiales bacterium]|nr:SRPBCC family protein [Acidimicrobiales bacterium]
MADQATEHMFMKAPPERCYEVVLDFERYPEWVADIKHVEVLQRDDQDRGTKVAFRAAAMGRSTSYTLAYDYSQAPREISWVLERGDITRRLDGTYVFEATDDGDGDGDGTEVTYHLAVELVVPLPAFIKSRAEGRIIGNALRELKARVESG